MFVTCFFNKKVKTKEQRATTRDEQEKENILEKMSSGMGFPFFNFDVL
jgi:hypothetical protein